MFPQNFKHIFSVFAKMLSEVPKLHFQMCKPNRNFKTTRNVINFSLLKINKVLLKILYMIFFPPPIILSDFVVPTYLNHLKLNYNFFCLHQLLTSYIYSGFHF